MADITKLDEHRKQAHSVCFLTLPPETDLPKGPFTVTVSDSEGKMFEVTFSDHTGNVPGDHNVLGTVGCYGVLANLLAGMTRIYFGAR
jgi:hypothetical protein